MNIQEKKQRMTELIGMLNKASKAYYAEDREILSDLQYDGLYDELQSLEKETGITLAGSPTMHVGYEAVDSLPKEAHESPMLSLNKTKDREQLRAFIGSNRTLLSWKMDGLTIVLTYRGGELIKAVTRGNGLIGEVVTNNARTFVNLPLRIAFRGELVIRGEAIITYSDFNRINEEIGDADAQYKNPRNLCSGSVRQLNNRITAERKVYLYVFTLVRAEGLEGAGQARETYAGEPPENLLTPDFHNSHEQEFLWLQKQGFQTVEYRVVTGDTLDEAMDYFSTQVAENDFPSDGLVALYDDIAYGASLRTTAKYPRNALAFKWADERAVTHLKEVEWSPSRTGLLNPVAVFDPVELEGTTVTRASVHNVSIVRQLRLGIGDEIEVYKANMIIPQIADNLTGSGTLKIPDRCPACGGPTELHSENDVETLLCPNPGCPAKAISSFILFVSRDAMNMDGISEATLETFMAHGLLHSRADLFRLGEQKKTIVSLEGFGEKSCEKLLAGIQRARTTTVSRFLFALGIPNIGAATAKIIARDFHEDLSAIRNAGSERLSEIEGIGSVIAKTFCDWWKDPENSRSVDEILPYLTFEKEYGEAVEQKLQGRIFVITGSLNHFAGRKELKDLIEKQGGRVTGSVSKKTDYLINNDAASASTKNRTAAKLGVPVITEDQFLTMFENGSSAGQKPASPAEEQNVSPDSKATASPAEEKSGSSGGTDAGSSMTEQAKGL
ncbi:MAG: NAD-dependent DNA ligase LigA [Eubacteriales bacterium]|jgi:DNA ligase (NAD+)